MFPVHSKADPDELCPILDGVKHARESLEAIGRPPEFRRQFEKHETRAVSHNYRPPANSIRVKSQSSSSSSRMSGSKHEEPCALDKCAKMELCVSEKIDRDFLKLPEAGPGDWLREHEEPGQTVDAFINRCVYAQRVMKPHPKSSNAIYVQPLGSMKLSDRLKGGTGAPIRNAQLLAPDSLFLPYLKSFLEAFFLGMKIHILPYKIYNVTRRRNENSPQGHQIHAGEIVNRFLPDDCKHLRDAYALIGVTMEDLYPRDSWNFVFGLASGPHGVFSFARYDDEDDDDNTGASEHKHLRTALRSARFLKKAVKVMGHELCHCFGLKHCVHFNCLMQGSNHALEAVQKFHELCPVCLKKVFFAVEFDPVERYEKLKQWVDSVMEEDPDLIRNCVRSVGTQGDKKGDTNCYQQVFGRWSSWYQRRIDAINGAHKKRGVKCAEVSALNGGHIRKNENRQEIIYPSYRID